jgi:serine protease
MRVRRVDETLGFATISVPTRGEGTDVRALAESVASREAVDYVEPVQHYWPQALQTAASAPNDPRLEDQYAPQQVNALQAWQQLDSEAQRDVTIAVIDQGAAYDHPDLQAQFGSNPGYDSTTIKAVPDAENCDETAEKEPDGDPYPEWVEEPIGRGLFCRDSFEIHATHVAGIAAATTDQGSGIAGVSDASLLSCRSLSMRGGRVDDIASSIRWAADNGADLINMSLGAPDPSETMHEAVKYARNKGVLSICAAGNNGGEVGYPAGFEEAVAVSAFDDAEQPASFTSRGPEVDVAGPGVNVLSSIPTAIPDRSGYERLSGTSMASPAVCGVAALGLAANPDWDADTLEAKLKENARPVEGVAEKFQGAGIADALSLVGDANGPPTAAITGAPDRVEPGATVTFDGSASSDDGQIRRYDWGIDGVSVSGDETLSYTFWTTGERTISLTVTDDQGATDSTQTTMAVGESAEERFDNNDRVATTVDLSVRTAPDTDASRIWVAPTGSAGYVRGGPKAADGYTWWEIEYNAGFQGWCAGSYLEAEPYTG